jgi:D-glycero-alpha-D-manno-heptose 1-phosphate guanylyltransferase
MNAIILCGGLSTRLGEITKSIPKILLEVGGKTVLDWQIESLRQAGFDSVILAGGHLAEVLRMEIGSERLGMRIVYAIEDKKLGTGGAIRNALSYVKYPDEPTIILNGDILTTVSYADILHSLVPHSDGVIFGSLVDDASTYGTLLFDTDTKKLGSFEEKRGMVESAYINGGIYLFTKNIHQYFPSEDSFSIEYDVLPYMKDLYVYPSEDQWIDVGVPERLSFARDNWRLFLNE